MIRLARRLFLGGMGVYLLSVTLIVAFAALWPDDLAESDMIVVLGAGMDADGTLHQSSILRVKRGVELWKAGVAPRLHFTGGEGRPGGPSAGGQMAALAIEQGVPAEAISFEGKSQSTLQNALFSQPMLAGAKSLTLVTEGFHLPRAWASFRWAGDHDLHLVASERFRSVSATARFPAAAMVLREGAAFWFNLGRAASWEVGGVLGVGDARRDGWLH